MRTILLLAGALTVAGCANRAPLPVAKTICVQLPQETEEEAAFARKKAAGYLEQWGFAMVEDGCDVSVKYSRFGGFQGEYVGRGWWGINRSGYWSQEGVVTVTAAGKVVLEDHTVALRGYGTKQDLLNDLGYYTVYPVSWLYRPPVVPK